MGKIVADPYILLNFQAYFNWSTKSHQFLTSRSGSRLPTAAKLLFETELYESLLRAGGMWEGISKQKKAKPRKAKRKQKQRKFRIWRRKVIVLEGFRSKISIFENLKNIIFSMSEIIFGHQIFIPEQSDIVRKLKNITSDEFWKNWFFHPILFHTWGKDGPCFCS